MDSFAPLSLVYWSSITSLRQRPITTAIICTLLLIIAPVMWTTRQTGGRSLVWFTLGEVYSVPICQISAGTKTSKILAFRICVLQINLVGGLAGAI
jgi:hypothetical protein